MKVIYSFSEEDIEQALLDYIEEMVGTCTDSRVVTLRQVVKDNVSTTQAVVEELIENKRTEV